MKRIVFLLILSLSACAVIPEKTAELNKLSYHNNPQRTGWNAHETVLTPSAVSGSSFGLLWNTPQFDSFDGMPPRLFASPLLLAIG